MSAKRKTTVGVIFGGRSVEHDVSVVTAHQIMRAFDRELYDVVPVYISRDGRWFSGDPLLDLKNYDDEIISLSGIIPVILSPGVQHHGLILNPLAGRFSKSEIQRLDVVFPAIHGTHGEDGTLQGLLELADIPYVGCKTLASAVANDKIITKMVLNEHDIPMVDGVSFNRADWLEQPEAVIERVRQALGFPVFVKPATTGSSIGIGRANDETVLRSTIDIAAHFDRRILVEKAITGHVEINCSVMGNGDDIRASVLEQPISWDEFLTYEEKYLRGNEGMKSAERIIPAPLSPALTARIQKLAIDAFRVIDGQGIARIDFLVKPDEDVVYLNEINTLPGSLAFYLWEPSGVSMSELVHQLVELAREAYAEKRRSSYDYRTDLINLAQMRGLKGVKGAKSSSTAAVRDST
ncbi:MAG: D-alanine--D-alanine ligase [Anaerolineae bacterium]|nr:D-alanine--D-alanine ligase [Anaerolineae bacterium]